MEGLGFPPDAVPIGAWKFTWYITFRAQRMTVALNNVNPKHEDAPIVIDMDDL